ASIGEAPHRRNAEGERADLKAGRLPEASAAKPAKLRHKGEPLMRHRFEHDGEGRAPDAEARAQEDASRWRRGRADRRAGLRPKSHIGADRRHRLIRTWSVTDAASYDGRALPGLLDTSDTGRRVSAGRHRRAIGPRDDDDAYRSRKNAKRIVAGLVSKAHLRRAPGRPLTASRQKATAARSRMRSPVKFGEII
ncbi:MAG: hypothetical protein AAF844_08110, partial [Pseudomonadota bacterium]